MQIKFSIYIEKILKVSHKYSQSIPLYEKRVLKVPITLKSVLYRNNAI